MDTKSELLLQLYQARLDRLKEISAEHSIVRTGSVETIRARLIKDLILDQWNLDDISIKALRNEEIGGILAVFGIKKSGSIRERKQRLWLHLNHDSKQLIPEKLDVLSRDELHELCIYLDLPRSGNKQALLMRVAGVLTSQSGSWGSIKKSLRRPRGKAKSPIIPSPSADDEEMEPVPSNEMPAPEPVMSDEEEFIEIEFEEVSPAIVEVIPTPKQIDPVALVALESRMPEIEAACRDFLALGNLDDSADVNSFIDSLSSQGFNVEDDNLREGVTQVLQVLSTRAQEENAAMHSGPNSWREREELRRFEDSRQILREALAGILEESEGDIIKARMNFEALAREQNLDIRMPSISGRVHALFDLHISIDEAHAASDPRTARRTRVARLLQHGAVHLDHRQRRTLDRLEKNIAGLEQLVETILDRAEGVYGEAEQALVIRFLENKGYEVNDVELRPRVLAAAGVIGAELGHISPADIPRLAPGILVDDTQMDSIITDLKRLANQFRGPQAETISTPEIEVGEAVADANDRIGEMKAKIDGIDELLSRLDLS
jgi:GrpB-like predicted nucleotidyltransferase (UPF0157 family)